MIFVLPVYYNEDEVRNFISYQLLSQSYSDIKIYVVVNGGDFYFNENAKVVVLHPEENLGYLGALRYVIEKEHPDFDTITLSNTDISFDDTGFLSSYNNALSQADFATAGPRIISSVTNTDQSPLYNEALSPKKLRRLKTFFGNYTFYVLYQSLFYLKRFIIPNSRKQKDIKNPYALHGSFITLSKKYFEGGGTLNYPVLLYGEELFLAEEARRIGLKNIFVSALKIQHNEHSTTGIYKSRKQVAYLKKSIEFILNRYYGGN